MRWDSLLQDPPEVELAKLPLFADEALVRRFNTPEFRGMTFYEVRAKSIVNHVKADNMGFRWTINPYRGCSHACSYCFARPTHTYLDMDAGRDFESKIVVKTNAVELLRRELRRPSWRGEHIAMGTNTDNYQRAEGRYRLMQGILEELNAVRNPYSILTKSTLIQRDLELLREGAQVAGASVSFSVGTVDDEVWSRTEPGTPHPRKRLELVRRFNREGIPTGVLMAPILPGISDSPEQLRETVKAIVEAGATHLTPIVLHLRRGVKEEFMPWLEETYPELVVPYREMYKGANAPKRVAEPIRQSVRGLERRFGGGRQGGHRSPAGGPAGGPEMPGGGPGGRETAAEGPAAMDGPAKDGPAKDGPAKDGPAKDGPAKDGPAKDGPAKDGPAEGGTAAGGRAEQLSFDLGEISSRRRRLH